MAIYWPIANGNWSTLSNWASSDGSVSGIANEFPSFVDDVYTNNRTITLNTSASIRFLTTAGRGFPFGSVFSGGTVSYGTGNRSLTCTSVSAGTTTPITFSATFPSQGTLVGNVTGSYTTNAAHGISHTGYMFSVYGNIHGGGPSQSNTYGCNTTGPLLYVYGNNYGGPGSENIATLFRGNYFFLSGDIYGGSGSSAQGVQVNCPVFAVMDMIGSSYGRSGNNAFALYVNNSNMTVNVTGNLFGGSGNASGLNIALGIVNSINIKGDCYGGTGAPALAGPNPAGLTGGTSHGRAVVYRVDGGAYPGSGSSAHGIDLLNGTVYVKDVYGGTGSAVGLNNRFLYAAAYVSGRLTSGPTGILPTAGNIYISPSRNSSASFLSILSSDAPNLPSFFPFPNQTYIRAISANTNYSSRLSGITGFNLLYSSLSQDSGTFMPSVSNVRFNTKYNFNQSTGIIKIPIPQVVLQGYNVDNTVGLAIADPSLVWVAPISSFQNDMNTLGGVITRSHTIESMGNTLKDLN